MKKKKIFKRIVIFLFLLLLLLIAIPFLLKDTLIKNYIAKVNNDYNINITYKNIDISLFKSFPSATFIINNLNITTEKPFVGDTLFYSKYSYVAINIRDAFKSNIEKIKVKELIFDNPKLNLKVAKNGIVNYNVTKKVKDNETKVINKKTNANDLTFKVNNYRLKEATILFDDKQNEVLLDFKNLNHSGIGDFSSSKMDLNTKTTIDALTVKLGEITYFNNAKIDLNAILGIDFNQNKYTFKENDVKINDLKLNFDGFVKLNKDAVESSIKFNAPNANFKNILSLIPNAYSTNFNGVTASGVASVSGFVKGVSSSTLTPKYVIKIKTNNASFKYPDLTKEVTNINFDGEIISNSVKNNVALDVKYLKFTIDKDEFETNGTITNLATNPNFNTTFKGILNLDNLTQAYPIKFEDKLTGVLHADFTTKADKKSIKNNDFDKINTSGNVNLKDFSYSGDNSANTVFIKNADIKFNTNTISLTDFNAKTGESDIKATGTLDNLYAFLFDKKDLKGRFNINANNIVISDFLVNDNKTTISSTSETTVKSSDERYLKIPDFLDIKTTVNAKKVVYDNLILNDVFGTMQLKNQKAILTNTKAKMLDGDISIDGIVDTKKEPSVFDLDMIIKDFDMVESFAKMETFQKIIPIAKSIKGKYNTAFKIKGNLNQDFSPNLNTINGNALAQLFVNEINENTSPLLQELTTNLSFIDLKKIKLDNLKTALTFQNGSVEVKPFDIKYKEITMKISGNHGFDKSLKYNMKIDLPAKYLGSEASGLLSKLTNVAKDTIKIPLTALISGSILKPIFNANFKQAMTDLAIKVAKYQKDQLINQATNQVNDIVEDVINDNSAINDILQDTGILKPKDSTNSKPTNGGIINDATNGILNGIFGKKKKKKKDTINY